MKEMCYTDKNIRELLHNDIYKGYHYYIMSYGTHPCCYIEINKNNILYRKNYSDIILNVHGGLTYSRDYLKSSDTTTLEESWFIGWDYSHCDDYSGYDERFIDEIKTLGKKWSIKELNDECKNAIDMLIKNYDLYKEYFECKRTLEHIEFLLQGN